jgi:hypothetical protein
MIVAAIMTLSLATATPALAQDSPGVLRPPEPPLPRYALTFSPIYLAVPMGKVSAEVRVNNKVGVSALAGLGWLTFTAPPVKTHLILYQVGAQGRYYVIGNFRHGVQLGAEVAYLHDTSPFRNQYPLSSDALSLAPFVGYKYTMRVGFTVETQLGYDLLLASGTSGESVVLFDIRIGWSF